MSSTSAATTGPTLVTQPGTPRVPCAGGVGMLEIRRSLQQRAGALRYERALARLSAEQRDEFEQLTPLAWLPLTTSSAVIDAVAAELGTDKDQLYDAVIREGIERTFRGVWKLLLHFTSDEAIITRAPIIYTKARNCGTMTASLAAPGRGECTVHGWPQMTERNMRAIALSMAAALELSGRKQVHHHYVRTADGAFFRTLWRV